MGTIERKQRERKQMERLILDASLKLFIDDGFENVSIRKIAERIEYSPATIYLYFKDKDEIFYALQCEAFDKFYQVQLSVQSIEDPLERLMAHGKAYIRFAFENSELFDIMFLLREPVKDITTLQEWASGSRSYELLKKNVRQCIEAGAIKQHDIESTSFALWALVHGIATLNNRRGMMIPENYITYLINGAFEFLKSGLGV